MNAVMLSGWQQPATLFSPALAGALHLGYGALREEAVWHALPPAPALAVGWSLGGVVLARALALGVCRPARLLLIGVPFSPLPGIKAMQALYRRHPARALARFQALLGQEADNPIWPEGEYWLARLAAWQASEVAPACFPETALLHGEDDRVVPVADAAAWARHLAHASLTRLPGAGHALHQEHPVVTEKWLARYV